MTVLSDGYTPDREELTRIAQLRTLAPDAHTDAIEVHKTRENAELRGSLHDHEPDLKEARGTHELHTAPEQRSADPHGMYWHVNQYCTCDMPKNVMPHVGECQFGRRYLRPHAWFVRYIAVQADDIFMTTREAIGKDEEFITRYQAIGDSLKAYIEERVQVNKMVAERKFRQELDDAAYQFCQAAKYKVDAEERAKFLVARDQDAIDNEQINALINRAQESAYEGIVVAYGVQHAGCTQQMNFNGAAKRVVEWSCKRLTDWFAERDAKQAQQQRLAAGATQAIVANMFNKGLRR